MSVSEREIQRLRQEVKELEESLQKAGQYGLQLLEDKMDLQNKLEEQQNEITSLTENLEQEKYSRQTEVELKSRMLDSLHSEFDAVKNQQKHLLEQQQTVLERNHAVELGDLKKKMEKMKSDLDEARLMEKQMRHKLELQSQTLSIKTEELRKLTENAHETTCSEVQELQIQKMDLEAAVAALEQELQEIQYKEQQQLLANSILQRQLESFTETKEEKEKELVSLYNALMKSREAYQELQIQLEQVMEQAQDPNSKGNSLFSEVEDKRAEMEKQLISMKVQYQSLQKQHTFTKQQMLRMKAQISNLMQLQGSRADPAQLERLQLMLSEKNREIEALLVKVHKLEKMETSEDQSATCPSKEVEFVDETYYTDVLKMQLSNSTKAAEKLKDELSLARMKALSESQRVLELERKLFGAENALKQGHSDNIKLQVKLEELQMKYEPNEVKKGQTQKRKREKIPLGPPEEKPDVSSVENPPNTIQERKAETSPCSTEEPVVTPLQPTQATKCTPALPCETKRVRTCEDAPILIPDIPKSPAADQEQIKGDDDGENWRADRRKKHQAPVHVDSKNTMERQCAQQ